MGFVNVGPLELMALLVIALLVLGPKRLPEAARSLGRGVREMKEALSGEHDDEDEDEDEEVVEDDDSVLDAESPGSPPAAATAPKTGVPPGAGS